MESDGIISLFDSCWFEMEIFKKQTSPSTSTVSEPNQDLRVEETSSKPEFTRTPSLHTRSMSDQLSLNSTSFIGSASLSPDSVLHSPKLHKIISGKEMTEEELQDNGKEDNKDSRLVEIIPGLQRLRRKDGEEENKEAAGAEDDDRDEVSRPYLSEAWHVSERRKENPLMNWRVPALGNEVDVKDSLRWWAHTVASTVK
ncbi:hypothetical protein GOBAR_DD28250 [Gossypium barbadense]|nr:hypothetical protein GOBAR_DD28250 [Gossypium barbadense]